MNQSIQHPYHATFTVIVNPSGFQRNRPSAVHNLYTTINCFLPSRYCTPNETIPTFIATLLFLIFLLLKLKTVVENVDIVHIPWIIVIAPIMIANICALWRNARPLYCKYVRPVIYGSNHGGYEGIEENTSGHNQSAESVVARNPDEEDSSNQRIGDDNTLNTTALDPSLISNGNSLEELRENLVKGKRELCHHISQCAMLLGCFYGEIVALLCFNQSKIPTYLTKILTPTWLLILFAISAKSYDFYILFPRLLELNTLRREYAGPTWSRHFVLIMFILARWLQPFLISCQLDGTLQRSWSVILSPCWILAFLGFAICLLLISFLPYMNPQQSYTSSPLKFNAHKVGYLLAFQIALSSIWLFWSILVISERLDFHENNQSRNGDSGPDENKGKEYSISTIMTPVMLLWITFIMTSPMLYNFTKAFETTLLSRAQESNVVSILTAETNNISGNLTGFKRCYVETIHRVVWLLQTGASTFVVADAKSLSQDSLSENAHIIPASTATSRSSSSSAGSGNASRPNPSVGAINVLANTTHSLIDWITPLFSGSVTSSASSHGLESLAPSTEQTVGTPDIEMSTLSANHSLAVQEGSSSSAYADIMMSSQSAIAMNSASDSGSSVANGGGATNYCVVCLSKPADSVIQDCGHHCCCAGCILAIAKVAPDPAHCACPVCRCVITTVLQLKGRPFVLDGEQNTKKTVAVSNITYSIHDSHDSQYNNFNILRRQLVSDACLESVQDHPSVVELLI